MYQINTLNLHNVTCQLYLHKAGKNKTVFLGDICRSVHKVYLNICLIRLVDCNTFYERRQAVSSAVPQEFLKHAIPDYFVRGTDLFSLKSVK